MSSGLGGTLSMILFGTVDKIFPAAGNATRAQIVIMGADDLYREIRVPNVFRDSNGKAVAIKEGTEVEIAIKIVQRTNTAD